jgi:hypothetical protein
MHPFHAAVSCATLTALLLAGCATGPKIRYDEDPAANFADYKTYGFLPELEKEDFGYQSLLTQYLKEAISREMAARGYQRAANPDLLVNFYVNTQEKVRATTTPTMGPGIGGYYGYRGAYYGGWGGYETTVTQYTEGTLSIDLVDAKRRQLVWNGIAVGRIRQATLDDLQGAVNRVVPLVFEEFRHTAGTDALTPQPAS